MRTQPSRAAGLTGTSVVGVAIAVPEPHGSVLQRWRASFGDPLAAAIPAHITLLPPVELIPAAIDGAIGHLADVAANAAPFQVRLRGTGTFRPVSPVVFVQVAEGLSECELLERAVRAGPLTRELMFYYHPHVTVAHHVDGEGLDRAFDALRDFDVTFAVEGFSLYEHGGDGVWRPQREFRFGG